MVNNYLFGVYLEVIMATYLVGLSFFYFFSRLHGLENGKNFPKFPIFRSPDFKHTSVSIQMTKNRIFLFEKGDFPFQTTCILHYL